MKRVLLAMLVALVPSCGMLGLSDSIDIPAARQELKELRQDIEPLFDAYVAAENDPELSEKWVEVKGYMDAASDAWDLYEIDPDNHAQDVANALNAVLDGARAMVPMIADDEDVLKWQTIITGAQIVIRRVATYIGNQDLAERAALDEAATEAELGN